MGTQSMKNYNNTLQLTNYNISIFGYSKLIKLTHFTTDEFIKVSILQKRKSLNTHEDSVFIKQIRKM